MHKTVKERDIIVKETSGEGCTVHDVCNVVPNKCVHTYVCVYTNGVIDKFTGQWNAGNVN